MAIEPEQAMAPVDQLVAATASPLERIEPPDWLKELAAMARAASADYITVPNAIRGRPGSILAVMMAGRELGLQPMESLRLINIINGTPTTAAELKARWIREAGHGLQIVFQDHNRLRLRGVRGDNGQSLEVEWAISRRDETSVPSPDATIAEEIHQGRQLLTEKDNWQNYPNDMLWSRCVAQLHRRLFPDVRGAGIYATEELDGQGKPDRAVVEGAESGTQVNTSTSTAGRTEPEQVDERQPDPSPQPSALHGGRLDEKDRERAYRDLAQALRGTGTTLRHWVQAVTGKDSWGECETADVINIVKAVREYRAGRLDLREENGLWFVQTTGEGESADGDTGGDQGGAEGGDQSGPAPV